MRSASRNEWAQKFAHLFGFTTEDALSQLREWMREIEAEPPELDSATDEILRAQDVPQSRYRLLHLLGRTVAAHRARNHELRREEQVGPSENCRICGGNGWVVVPHVKCLYEGEYVPIRIGRGSQALYYTMAVACSCGLGEWKRNHSLNRDGHQPMSILEYDMINPHWERQLQQRDRELRALASVRRDDLGIHDRASHEQLQEVLDRITRSLHGNQ